MPYGILGPLEVRHGDGPVALGGPQQRTVLAVLLANAGRVVSTDRLIDHLWGEQPPGTARALLQGCVAGLRRTLRGAGVDHLVTRPPGYLIAPPPGELDAERFEELAAAAQQAAEPQVAAGYLDEALALWRGPVLDGLTVEGLAPMIARLEERRLEVFEERADLHLRLGRGSGLIGELREHVREHPLRERAWEQLMIALHRTGRQADALAAFRQLREVLVEQLGVEPGPSLQELHQAILTGQSAPPAAGHSTGPSAVPGTPAQLPAAVAGFTGRGEQLARLDELAAKRDTMVIATITGPPGVGKSALAVSWAHQAREHYPDGQLYVDLRGYAATKPVPPLAALTGFLTALGVPTEQQPQDLAGAAARFRSVVDGRRMLVVLDDALDADQVRPLLPGSPGCLVLVTSRHRLGGLTARDGAHRLPLDVLPADEAQALLGRILGPHRLAEEPAAVRRLCGLCGYLPLALRIAAAELTGRVSDRVTALTEDPLGALNVDGDPASTVRAAFDLSYSALDPQARRLFRLLGLPPAVDVPVRAAAALAGIDGQEAQALLTRLASAHLVEQRGPDRFTTHPLLCGYAAERAQDEDSATERETAVVRWFDWYTGMARTAARALNPEMLRLPGAADEYTFAHTAALAWLDTERPNLVAAVGHAAAHGVPPAAWLIADALRGYLWLRMRTFDWRQVAGDALDAAVAAGDLFGQAASHLSLGDVHGRMGEHDRAAEHYLSALALNEESGWVDGESAAAGNLGNLYWWAGRLPEAVEQYTHALALAERTGRTAGQAVNLGNLGAVYWNLGELERSAACHREALALDRRLGSRLGEAVDLGNLARVCVELSRFGEAISHLDRALALHREIGDHSGEAEALRMLAEAHRGAGRTARACALAEDAVRRAETTGSVRHEADALNTAGTCAFHAGDPAAAVRWHEAALARARTGGGRYPEIVALIGLALACADPGVAVPFARRAVSLACQEQFHLLRSRAQDALDKAVEPVGKGIILCQQAL